MTKRTQWTAVVVATVVKMSVASRIYFVLKRFWLWLRLNDRQLLVVFAFVAGIYSLFEYSKSVSADADQRVAQYIQRFGSGEILKSNVFLEMFQNSPEVAKLTASDYDASIAPKINDKEFLTAVITELNFYDSLDICVDAEQCSRVSSCKYFFSQAEGFLQDNRPIVSRILLRANQGAQAYVADFAHVQCKEFMPKYCQGVGYKSVDCQDIKHD